MPEYQWKNTNGEIISVHCKVEDRDVPPPGTGWVRLYPAPAIGKVDGAGDSPARKAGK